MQENELRALIEEVRTGALPRRGFIQQMVGLGLTAPMASMLLMHEGLAQTAAPIPYKGTKRGGGGTLKLLYWQGPVHLNPHFAGGTKEQEATRIFYEPLAGWDADGNLIPMLATEVPSTSRMPNSLAPCSMVQGSNSYNPRQAIKMYKPANVTTRIHSLP